MHLGIGYRLLWLPVAPRQRQLQHGPQLFKLGAGLDAWMADGYAVGPWIAAEVGTFSWRDEDRVSAGASIFAQAGVRLRFELWGNTERRSTAGRAR